MFLRGEGCGGYLCMLTKCCVGGELCNTSLYDHITLPDPQNCRWKENCTLKAGMWNVITRNLECLL